jgi:hypothetical protein
MYLLSFLTLALGGDKWLTSRTDDLLPGKNTSAH